MAKKVNKVVIGNKTLIDLTEDTVTPAHLAEGVTAYDKTGQLITGEMEIDEPDDPNYTVKYAVRIYGIKQDVDEQGNTLGLTFGPASGYTVGPLANKHYNSGHIPDDGKTCISKMSWSQIIRQAKKDPTVFQTCLEKGCTHSVNLNITGQLANTSYAGQMDEGDGTSVLYTSVAYDYVMWNPSFTTSGGWQDSMIRNTLNGVATTNSGTTYAACDKNTCLLAMFPQELQRGIVAKTVLSGSSPDRTSTLNTTYDKLWLFSSCEMYKPGGYEYDPTYIDEREGQLYQSQDIMNAVGTEYVDDTTVNIFYNEFNLCGWPMSRSLYYSPTYNSKYIVMFYEGSPFYSPTYHGGYCHISPGFCVGIVEGENNASDVSTINNISTNSKTIINASTNTKKVNKITVKNETLFDISDCTVDAKHLSYGYTAHDNAGNRIIGEYISSSIVPEYIKDGLQLHLDGINNTRSGHDNNSSIWEDLTANEYDFQRKYETTAPVFDDNSYVNNGDYHKGLYHASAIMKNLEECTVEICWNRVDTGDKSYQWAFQNRQNSANTIGDDGFQFIHSTGKSGGETIYPPAMALSIFNITTDPNWSGRKYLKNYAFDESTHTQAFTYKDGVIKGFLDGILTGQVDNVVNMQTYVFDRTNYDIGGSVNGWSSNSYPLDGHIYSIRIYDHALSESEMLQNFLTDKQRFIKEDVSKVIMIADNNSGDTDPVNNESEFVIDNLE